VRYRLDKAPHGFASTFYMTRRDKRRKALAPTKHDWIIARSSDLQYNGGMATQDIHRDEWLNDGEEQMPAEDDVWEAAYARHKDKFLTLRAIARAEIDAGASL
jgi:hypothetical protein